MASIMYHVQNNVVIMFLCTHKASGSHLRLSFKCQRLCNRVYSKKDQSKHFYWNATILSVFKLDIYRSSYILFTA